MSTVDIAVYISDIEQWLKACRKYKKKENLRLLEKYKHNK